MLQDVLKEYEKKCTEISVVPCIIFTEALDNCIRSSTFLTRVILPGNSKALFNARLTDLACIPLIDACIACGTVEALDLSRHHIGNNGASALARILERNQLRELDVSHNNIETAGCERLMQGLRANNTLTRLSLAHNPIGNEGGMQVAEMLQMNQSLVSLDLSDCELATESVIAFATVLLTNTRLQRLGLANPRLFSLQEEPLVHVASMLRVNATLTALDLSKHGIRDEGARVLCADLQGNQTLRHLTLRCNHITMEGGAAFGKLLQVSALVSLDLSGNRVGDLGAASIAHALETNRRLTSLDLTNNSIGEAGLLALARALASNETLVRLLLWGNRFTPPAADALGKILSTSRALTDTDIVVYTTSPEAGAPPEARVAYRN